MTNQQILEGSWSKIKGRIRERWGQLTDDDLSQTRGNAEQIIGNIQRKTGESREAVEEYLQDVAQQAVATAQEALEAAQRTAGQFTEEGLPGYKRANRFIRQRPMQALLASFAIGVTAGMLIGFLPRSR